MARFFSKEWAEPVYMYHICQIGTIAEQHDTDENIKT